MRKRVTHPLGVPVFRNAADIVESEQPVTLESPREALGLEHRLLRQLMAELGNPAFTVALWDGKQAYAPPEHPVARIVIHSPTTFWKLLLSPELAFGDGYASGSVSIEGDLIALNIALIRARRRVPGTNRLRKFLAAWLEQPESNTAARSRNNIHHHYDLGNDFYRLWLDRQMVYTCAYYTQANASLEEAQLSKMEHVCRKLQLQPGQQVVEAGCGWGALARYMARHYGVSVRAYNISHEQVAYARQRAAAEGLADLVEYVEDDYRGITGSYDAFVSIGMLEHVGTGHYRDLGNIIATCLKDTGRGLIHSIGRYRPAPNNVWIEKRIFPGSYPPSVREMMDIFEPSGLSVLDLENLRLHYARTLEHWLERFEEVTDQVEEMYDPAFVRAWRLYLTGSIAAFRASSLQLYQVVFAFPHNNEVPWTRHHLYRG